ncbi:MAG: YggT family protein, partial [Anaerolineae bacterium]|nr:YggT family protein [Anaerolineae bacterium]
ATVEREEKVIISNADHLARRKQIVRNIGAQQRLAVAKVNRIIWLLVGVLETLIGMRVLLKLISANPNNTFASFVYSVTDVFLWPFSGLITSPASGDMVLEISSLIAMSVYALAAWVLVRLLWVIFYRPNERVVTTYEQVD